MAQAFPAPTGPLGYLRVLSPTAGVKVSPLCLGTMSLGSKWSDLFGNSATKDQAFEYLDVYRNAGGNFIDTANMYQNGEAETILGEWMLARGCRDEMVIATKYTYCYHPEASYARGEMNWQGNNSKSLHHSIENSLKRLKTDYLDIFYVHFWDYTTSIPEVMNALDTLIRQRKVLYLGISDTPAWIVAKTNEYARQKGLTPFSIYQGKWSLIMRDIESDTIPMLRADGMALTPYGVSGTGKFKSASEVAEREKAGMFRFGQAPTDQERAMSKALEEVGSELEGNPSPASVAQAWSMTKAPYVFPLVGGNTIAHLKSNIEALKITLNQEQIHKLESVQPFNPPFPQSYFGVDPATVESGVQTAAFASMPYVEFVRAPGPLGQSKVVS